MANVYYRKSKEKPTVKEEDEAVALEDKDFMVYEMIKEIIAELKREANR